MNPDDFKKETEKIIAKKKCSYWQAVSELCRRPNAIGAEARRRKKENLQRWKEAERAMKKVKEIFSAR